LRVEPVIGIATLLKQRLLATSFRFFENLLMRTTTSFLLASLFAAFASASASCADTKPIAPLFKGLGRHHWPVTTKYELAQRYFDQGLTLLYNFNHAEAIRSFEMAARLDPGCAMAHWGIAYALGPNINAPMFPVAVKPAWEAVQRAIALKPQASAKELALIEALSRRYAENPPEDRAPLDLAYADAMREVGKRFGDDNEVLTLLAEALMDTAPWNYWTPEQQLKPAAREAVAAIERVLGRVKAHPGADHLYIHLVEAGPNPEKGVPSAERLAKLAPAAGHIVHMPSHIFLRVGRYHDASEWNDDAMEEDEAYIRRVKPASLYSGGYYPHNVHFYWYSTMMEGRGRESLKAAQKLAKYTIDLRCGAVEGPRQRYTPVLTHARLGHWDEVLRTALPGEEMPFDRAMTHFARGIAFAAQGRGADAEAELQKFTALESSDQVNAMDNPYFPGTRILAVANQVLTGQAAGARGDTAKQLQSLRHAVELEDALPYMEPPYWHYSTRLTLGAAQLRAGDAAGAEQSFRADVRKHPNNGWGFFGHEASLRQQGKTADADKLRKEFQRAWRYADMKPDLAWY
jgi:tetratricopeptide (TPR) repeat protein